MFARALTMFEDRRSLFQERDHAFSRILALHRLDDRLRLHLESSVAHLGPSAVDASPNAVDRAEEVGFRNAVRERDDPFGDYGSRPEDDAPDEHENEPA